MTAVEFLEEKLLELFENHLPFELLEEAKEMEKQQIFDAYLNGRYESDKIVMSERFYKEQYYKETFNK
jgi:hypothetical protein